MTGLRRMLQRPERFPNGMVLWNLWYLAFVVTDEVLGSGTLYRRRRLTFELIVSIRRLRAIRLELLGHTVYR